MITSKVRYREKKDDEEVEKKTRRIAHYP